ncbi:bactofilin family protein [Candidatus Venteria ishoeyi]|uniref:Polymer-forming cytoskeletal n=1 Tax=Candidatus Venteria ishoeyi TaxID=1899563 RepID=A0A1H6FDS9_9GAMM|nr:polymer-forming cytoskeletal protein [Candidatus Venteria ishoeyi]SEH07316.1 Polymer-forming cytoskeletal [Candidatus Venteria ishoeyi]
MWGKKEERVTRIDSLIGQETQLNGDLHFSGGLHVDGKITGNVYAGDDSTSVLTLSEQGIIEGEIHVPNVILNGQVTGDVYASEHIELALNARITGNVYYNLFEMAMGAEVNGNLVHKKDWDKSAKPQKGKASSTANNPAQATMPNNQADANKTD